MALVPKRGLRWSREQTVSSGVGTLATRVWVVRGGLANGGLRREGQRKQWEALKGSANEVEERVYWMTLTQVRVWP